MSASLDNCGESCAWTAAIIATVAYGTLGVPIKYTKHIPDLHPLVFQSYKTATLCVTCWLVILMHIEPSFTPWGILSGLLAILGGVSTVYAIRTAGMAAAVGTWASVKVMMSFFWGILIFQEPVGNIVGTVCAFLVLALGLVGMSYYSAPSTQLKHQQQWLESGKNDVPPVVEDQERGSMSPYKPMPADDQFDEEISDDKVQILGFMVTKRVTGIGCAVFNGLVTGSALVPLHYAKDSGYGGANFIISVTIGMVLANVLLWVALFAYRFEGQRRLAIICTIESHTNTGKTLGKKQSLWVQTYHKMPCWHFSQLILPGLAGGLLMSVIIFGCVLSVTVLGQGLGYSIVQTQILISGLWGIFWFKEIRGCVIISKWFSSALVAIAGIVWLGLEHKAATANAEDG